MNYENSSKVAIYLVLKVNRLFLVRVKLACTEYENENGN